MASETLEQIFVDHPFIRNAGREVAECLARCARDCSFEAGDYLWRQGEQADVLYLIRTGDVALEIFVPNEGPLQIEVIGKGEALGWSWLVDGYEWPFDARAVGPVQAFALDGQCLREQFEQDPEMGYRVLKCFTPVLARRLTETRLRLAQLNYR